MNTNERLSPFLLRLIVGLFVALTVCEGAARWSLLHYDWRLAGIDVQTPVALGARLQAFDAHAGTKWAIVGDSLIRGETMAQHGIDNWREHTIDRQLSDKLSSGYGDDNVLVANFGIDGFLPTEIDRLTRMLELSSPSVLAVDVGIRSFSDNFNQADAAWSRQWMRDFKWTPGSGFSWELQSERSDPLHYVAHVAQLFLANNLLLYQAAEIARLYLLAGHKPSAWVAARRNEFDQWITGESRGHNQRSLLLLSKRRYATISFGDESMQARALRRLLSHQWQVPLIVIYATENPALIRQIMSRDRLDELRGDVGRLVEQAQAANQNVLFVPALAVLEREQFLDLIHVDPNGYEVYATKVLDAYQAAARVRGAEPLD